jgi:phosphoribosylaminoimidazolecarboxamide formyltransferase/IMP cyclohydrolase
MITPVRSALISVYYKDGIDRLCRALHASGAEIISTGGTRTYIENLGIPVTSVESLTGYPEILGGRVKTLHPAIFGGILGRRGVESDRIEMENHHIRNIDLVVVDLYPFAETLANSNDADVITEKIDIGGVSLIRAAAKNHAHTAILSRKEDLEGFIETYEVQGGTTAGQRKALAAAALQVTSAYDAMIASWLAGDTPVSDERFPLRYGENPHQAAWFQGNLSGLFHQHHGKELSYNNLLDADAAVMLMADFKENEEAVFAILKHNNACGFATADTLEAAWEKALAADPVSAFGGVLICNRPVDIATAEAVNQLFFEILIAPGYEAAALELLKSKKNRMLLEQRQVDFPVMQRRSVLNGILWQQRDQATENRGDFQAVTTRKPADGQMRDLEYALCLVKHTRSNAIVLVKDGSLLAAGTGQTSRVDALEQAIAKARRFGFNLEGASMASDAFFPFPDCVEIAAAAGISAIVQPGGSLKDQLSIDAAEALGLAMVFTGKRHFRH